MIIMSMLMKMILRMMVSLHTAGLIHGILRRAFTTTSSDTTNTSRHKKANTRSKPTNFYTQKASCHNASFQKRFHPFLHQALTRKLCTKGFYIPQALHRHSFPAASFFNRRKHAPRGLYIQSLLCREFLTVLVCIERLHTNKSLRHEAFTPTSLLHPGVFPAPV